MLVEVTFNVQKRERKLLRFLSPQFYPKINIGPYKVAANLKAMRMNSRKTVALFVSFTVLPSGRVVC